MAFRRVERGVCFGVRGLLLVAFAALFAGFTPANRIWPDAAKEPIRYQIQPTGSDDVRDGTDLAAIRNAFASWAAVSCSFLSFAEEDFENVRLVQRDGRNVVLFAEAQSEWTQGPEVLALTFSFTDQGSNGLSHSVDADIVMNGVDWVFTAEEAEVGQGVPAKVDIETVVLHEVGHLLGLGHSTDAAASMFDSNNKLVGRAPALDDIRGVCALYPNGEPVPQSGTQTGFPLGAVCENHVDCQARLCVDDEAIGRAYCTANCEPPGQDVCPAGFRCGHTAQGTLCLAPHAADELCDRCSMPAHCTSGLCYLSAGKNGGRRFCTQSCNVLSDPSDCPPGFSCEGGGGSVLNGACVPDADSCQVSGKGGQDEFCFADGTCKAGFSCVEYLPGSGLNYCYFTCTKAFVGVACGEERRVCRALATNANLAACFTIAGVGQPCIPELCDEASFCAFDETVGVDSALCYRRCPLGTCPDNSTCQTFANLPPLCVPKEGFLPVGNACSGNEQCETNVCRSVGASRLCTEVCTSTSTGTSTATSACGQGFRCLTPTGSSGGVCWPEVVTGPPAPVRSPSDFGECPCNTSTQCEEGCGCDPDCDGGCGCKSAPAPMHPAGEVAFMLFVAWWWVRRRAFQKRPLD